jgi:hypothetical protein
MLTAIEAHLRTDEDVGRGFLVIRARPLTVEGLLAAAGRTLDEFSWNEVPLAAVSAEVTGPDRTIKDLLAGPRLRTRHTYASAPVLDLIAGGFSVLPTFTTPHVSIVLPEYDEAVVRTLLTILGPEQANPYFMRTPQ